ncbi:histidine phosphatase family protein [Aestuariibacter sp. A3R04]|uniref:histidine phosphatase family protein n=1 Tax=Aestuariibacter sp. A3R04 TaxID=2841571 RepID=UPI001C09942B|nr:histidine phosphatase family protein [Aestuariibacter sp. A3R04]MBU3020626.1 histidine phosphatase family protein [Aestuariibacter sp. A3R04]
MEIVLIRHGKPLSASNHRMNCAGYADWIRKYNRSGLDPNSNPLKVMDLSQHYHLCSDLLRARLSAQKYSASQVHEYHSVFREMEIPYYRIPGRRRAWTWVYLCRAYWMMGRAGAFESYCDAKARAAAAVNLLETRVKTHSKVVVFGHGMMNRTVRKLLAAKGWNVAEKDNHYWGVNRLYLPE